MSKPLTIRLETTRAEADAERAAAEATGDMEIKKVEPIEHRQGGGLTEARFVEPVSLIATVTISLLAKRFADHWLKGKEEGVLIDLRQEPPLISRIAGIPRGQMVIVDKSGKARAEKAKYDKGEDLVPLLSSILGAGAA